MTQFCIEEAIVMRLRAEEMNREKEVSEKDDLHSRLLEIAGRQGKGGR